MIVLFNGATGGIGRHLGAEVARRGYTPKALRSRLEDQQGLTCELDEVDPSAEIVFVHLAAMVSVPACENDPELARVVNVDLASRALEQVISRRCSELRVIYLSTGHVYATTAPGSRIREDAELGPRSVYAQTKSDAEERFRQICRDASVPLVIARLFGLIGPGQPSNYVLPALIERVLTNQLDEIPGLDYVRDYLDARDVGRCLVDLADALASGTPEVVNVCSGEGISIRQLLREVLVVVDPNNAETRAAAARGGIARADDIPWIVGDPTTFRLVTGNEPRSITVAASAADAVHWSENGRQASGLWRRP